MVLFIVVGDARGLRRRVPQIYPPPPCATSATEEAKFRMMWGFDTTMTHGSKRATTIDLRIAGFQWVQAGFKKDGHMQIARWAVLFNAARNPGMGTDSPESGIFFLPNLLLNATGGCVLQDRCKREF
jgi:hypothetical protein